MVDYLNQCGRTGVVMKRLLLILLLCGAPACAGKAQPQLTPVGQAAVTSTQVIKALDVVRDTAVDLNAQNPPILSKAVTLQIVNVHESAVKVILAAPSGWKATVSAALGQLQVDLRPQDYAHIAPYVALVQTLIASVS